MTIAFGSLAKTTLDSLAKLASLTQTILGLLDLRSLRLTRSLAEPASLAYTHQSKFEKITFFCEKPDLRTKGFLLKNYFLYELLKTVLHMGILKFFWKDPNLVKLLNP